MTRYTMLMSAQKLMNSQLNLPHGTKQKKRVKKKLKTKTEMLRRNGPIIKSVESVLRLEGSIWWERSVKEVGRRTVLISFLLSSRHQRSDVVYCMGGKTVADSPQNTTVDKRHLLLTTALRWQRSRACKRPSRSEILSNEKNHRIQNIGTKALHFKWEFTTCTQPVEDNERRRDSTCRNNTIPPWHGVSAPCALVPSTRLISGLQQQPQLNFWHCRLISPAILANLSYTDTAVNRKHVTRNCQITQNQATSHKHIGLTSIITHTHTPPFYGPFSGITRVSRCQKRTNGLYSARED